NPYEEHGYILGKDQDGNIICMTDDMLRSHVLVVGGTGTRKTSLIGLTVIEFLFNSTNRLFIFDYAGEYYHLLKHDFILLRPGSKQFPIGINFLDWPRTLGLDVYVVESWILKILSNFVKDRGDFSPKMEAMLRDTIRGLLEQGGNLVTLIENLKSLKTELYFTKKRLREKQKNGHKLSEDERITVSDIGQHDPTVEALINRLTDLYGSPLRSVFFVEETTLSPQDLLQSNVIFDLSQLRREMAKPEHLRLLIEFLLLYLSQGILDREKGQWDIRNIMIIEEAQLITPEIFSKLTAIDGTQPEEMLGTLGGFGLSLMFVSAQPHKLSKSIIAGTHTSIVFGVKPGIEAEQLSQTLNIGDRELSLLQPGHCLVWSRGRGITKIKAQTLRIIPKEIKKSLEALHETNPPTMLRKTREKYQMLKRPPKGVYASILDTIQTKEPLADENPVRDLNAILKHSRPKFTFRDEFCDLCTLEKSLRDIFCISYRERIIEDLSDPEVLNPLKTKFDQGYDLFLAHCFQQSKNPAVNMCNVATFLSFIHLSTKQQQILFEITRNFIKKHTS
ncbi:MAG: helicase HerA domain-containing protein, partial [Candidatus Heimdallarchaeota archaeon]